MGTRNPTRYGSADRGKYAASQQRLEEVEGQVSEVTHILHDTLEQSIQRGEKLDRLDRRAEDLASESRHFKNQSRSVARTMWWKNKKWQVVLAIVVLIILAGIGVILYWEFGRKKK